MNWLLPHSTRLVWTPTGRQTIWAAGSRTARSPTRVDADALIPVIVVGGDFDSENVIGCEPDAEVGS